METNSFRYRADIPCLLVMGYRGTLCPVQREVLPPAMEVWLQPWLAQAMQRLTERVPQLHRIFQGEPVPLDSLLALLKDRLTGILTQALGAIGIESSETSAGDILREFPLLDSLIRSAIGEWIAATLTFLQRLHRDQSWLASSLGLVALPPIESISATASDTHAGGHSVLRVCFRGGSCLYYKPRPLTGEWLWQHLLGVIASLDSQLRLPAARVLAKDADSPYGWTESVLPEERWPSPRTEEASNIDADYWHAAGAMLCFAQNTCLTDLHLGNILATPSGPAVTDAECFATPNLHCSPSEKSSSIPHPFSDTLQAILNTGLLPGARDSDLPDVSGLFGHSASVSVVRLPGWSLSPDGRYQFASVSAQLVDHRNAPAPTTPVAVVPQMANGYRHAAELLIRARKTLLAPGSLWRSVLEMQHAPRIVLRDTLTYGCLLTQSLQPEHLRSRYCRRSNILVDLQRHSGPNLPAALLRAELAAILQLHTPRLVVLPDSRTLATGCGRPIVRNFTAAAPAHSVLRSIETLSCESMDNLHIPALLSAIL